MIATVLILTLLAAPAEELLIHRGPGFTLRYPEKNSKVQPPSAAVPFQLVYRKNSLFRLETERLTRPIDLSDDAFANIFMEVQLEALRERVTAPLESQQILNFPWGRAVEFVYYIPARSGKKNRRDLVTEVVTTHDEMLYRFTFWIPERDLKNVAAPLRGVLASFELEGATAAASPSAEAEPPVVLGGNLEYSMAGVERIIDAYRRLIRGEMEKVDADAHANLAEALGWRAYLDGEISAAELEEIQREAETASSMAPDDIDSLQAQAYAYYHANRMVEMEKSIQAALKIDPDDSVSHLLSAIWYSFNPAESKKHAEAALERDPSLEGAYYVKALADRKLGNVAEARTALEQAVELDPRFARAYSELADILEESGDSEGALRALRMAASGAPRNVDARFELALALRRAGQLDQAIKEYRDALQIDDNLPEVHYNLAVLFLQEKEQPEVAAEHFKRFLELDPESDKAEQVESWLRTNGYK